MKNARNRLALRPPYVVALGVTVWLLHAAAPALAEEFKKFEGKPTEAIPSTPFVVGAYGFIWAAVLVYVLLVARGLAQAQGEIAELKKKLANPSVRK
jgi:CcmD family protein